MRSGILVMPLCFLPGWCLLCWRSYSCWITIWRSSLAWVTERESSKMKRLEGWERPLKSFDPLWPRYPTPKSPEGTKRTFWGRGRQSVWIWISPLFFLFSSPISSNSFFICVEPVRWSVPWSNGRYRREKGERREQVEWSRVQGELRFRYSRGEEKRWLFFFCLPPNLIASLLHG